jgi:hypothetical protein
MMLFTQPDSKKYIYMFEKGEYDKGYFENLKSRITQAKSGITVICISHTHLLSSEIAPLLLDRSTEIPIKLYFLNPQSTAKEERYRLEPRTARFHEGDTRFERMY